MRADFSPLQMLLVTLAGWVNRHQQHVIEYLGFRGIVEGSRIRVVLTPFQAPNANAYAERFVRSIRDECLDRLILFGERRLIHTLDEFAAHYHGERNHQGLGNELITPAATAAGGTKVRCRERLGGLLRYYHCAA